MALDHICSKCKNIVGSKDLLRKDKDYVCRDCFHSTGKCDGCDGQFSILHEINDFDSTTKFCDACYLRFNNLPLTNFSLN